MNKHHSKTYILLLVCMVLASTIVSASEWIAVSDESKIYHFEGEKYSFLEGVQAPKALAVDPTSGAVFVLHGDYKDVSTITPEGDLELLGETKSYQDRNYMWGGDITVDASGNVWIADGSHVMGLRAKDAAMFSKFVASSTPYLPYLIEYDKTSRSIWAAGITSIAKYNMDGKRLLVINGFNQPQSMAINQRDGTVAIVDIGSNLVKVFTSQGNLVRSLRPENLPNSVIFHRSDLWMVDHFGTLRRYDNKGHQIATIEHNTLKGSTKLYSDEQNDRLVVITNQGIVYVKNPRDSYEITLFARGAGINDVAIDHALRTASPKLDSSVQLSPTTRISQNNQISQNEVLQSNDGTMTTLNQESRSKDTTKEAPTSTSSKEETNKMDQYQENTPVSNDETQEEVTQLRKQVSEQQRELNNLRSEKTQKNTESLPKKSSELIGVLVVTFLILLVLAFLGGMMLKKKE